MIRPRFTPLLAALLLGCCGPLLAAPKHALTLYDEPPKYLNSHRLAYRNRFAFVATPPYTLGLRAWWQKNLETSR